MEKFTIDQMMETLDKAGENSLVMVNINALEITENELIEMLTSAEDIYKSERGNVRIMACKLGKGSYYVSLVNDESMEVAA